MNKEILTVAVVPARAGSKGVKGKNLKKLNNVPLVAWTLHAAFNANKSINDILPPAYTVATISHFYDVFDFDDIEINPVFDAIVLTSESDEILEIGKKVAEQYEQYKNNPKFIPYKRDKKLSQDHVQTDEVVLDVLRFLEQEGHSPDEICLLQPTSPFRDSNHISESYGLFNRSSANCVLSAEKIPVELDGYTWFINEETYKDNTASPIGHKPEYRYGRQWEPPLPKKLYKENGAIYWFDASLFSLSRTYRKPPFAIYEMDKISSLDINTEEDWERAEQICQRKK